MNRRRGSANVAASPVLIGAATVLVALVAVFIAYNANAGLPFVPTYELRAELPSGGKLVKGNEVRVGGFRVGVVKEMTPKVTRVNGERRAVAVAKLSLDKRVEPLARDTKFRVRPRSALGLKYIELQPGTSRATWQSGDTVPGRAVIRAARVRGPVLDVRPRHASGHPERDGRLRERVRRARPVHQPRRSRRSTRSSGRSLR